MKGILANVLAAAALIAFGAAAEAQEKVIWWDFLGGGDGARMKTLIEKFNQANAGKIEIQATTLDWGVPFYTKVQTSVAVGEGPDVMTYHTSRIPLAVSQNILQEITADDMAAMGFTKDSFPAAIWEAIQDGGKPYAVPLDTHPIVLYYNKDKLAAAGLIGADGKPTGLDGVENFSAALKKLQEGGTKWGMSTFTAAGDFQFRTIYSLLCQLDGEMLTGDEWLAGDNKDKLVTAVATVSNWVKDGHVPAYTEYPAAIALFTSGESAMHINGVWEVPTFTDLAAQNKLGFEWGAVELPTFFNHACTYSDSHAFAIPANASKTMTPERRAAVLNVIGAMLDALLFFFFFFACTSSLRVTTGKTPRRQTSGWASPPSSPRRSFGPSDATRRYRSTGPGRVGRARMSSPAPTTAAFSSATCRKGPAPETHGRGSSRSPATRSPTPTASSAPRAAATAGADSAPARARSWPTPTAAPRACTSPSPTPTCRSRSTTRIRAWPARWCSRARSGASSSRRASGVHVANYSCDPDTRTASPPPVAASEPGGASACRRPV